MTDTDLIERLKAKWFVVGFCAGVLFMGVVIAAMATFGLIQ